MTGEELSATGLCSPKNYPNYATIFNGSITETDKL